MNKESTERSEYFEQWGIYRKVIHNNYMFHSEIIDIVKSEIRDSRDISVLDLGCGDSHVFASSIDNTLNFKYLGIDTSSSAIRFSKNNLRGYKVNASYINGDFFTELEKLKLDFDMIISGYSLHHLEREKKEKFFSLVFERLSDNGIFIFYDLELGRGESPSDYMERECPIIRRIFQQFNRNEMDIIMHHMNNHDIPESGYFHMSNMKKNRFSDIKKRFRDENDLYSLYVSRKRTS